MVDVYIVYAKSSALQGSTTMRAFQLTDIVNAYGSGLCNIKLISIRNLRLPMLRLAWCMLIPKGSVVWFCKDSVSRLDKDALEMLYWRSSAVIVDHIDRNLEQLSIDFIDCNVAISKAQANYFENLSKQAARGITEILNHHVNSFFYKKFARDNGQIRLGYFGALQNVVIFDDFKDTLRVYNSEDHSNWVANAALFGACTAHYAVRPSFIHDGSRLFKPMLKAYTAAVCGVPLIINADHDGAQDLLSPEYPYFAHDTSCRSIVKAIERLHETWHGPEYKLALDILSDIRSDVSPRAIAVKFETIIERSITYGKQQRK